MNADELALLCQKMQQGDQSAFAALYEACYVPIYRYIYGMTFSKEESEDVTQETFLRVAKAISSFKTGSLLAWMYTIARNILFDKSRKSKKTTPLLDEHEDLATYDKSVDAELLLESRILELKEQISHLTIHEREMLILKYWNELDMSQIAVLIGKSHVAVRKEMSRIISKLRQMQEVNKV